MSFFFFNIVNIIARKFESNSPAKIKKKFFFVRKKIVKINWPTIFINCKDISVTTCILSHSFWLKATALGERRIERKEQSSMTVRQKKSLPPTRPTSRTSSSKRENSGPRVTVAKKLQLHAALRAAPAQNPSAASETSYCTFPSCCSSAPLYARHSIILIHSRSVACFLGAQWPDSLRCSG